MRILQVLSTLCTGGAETFTVGLTNELLREGYVCDLVTLFDIENDNTLLNKLDSRCHHHSLHKAKGYDPRCYLRLYRLIKEGKYDVVHAHVGAIPYLLIPSILLKNIRFVATIHSEATREAGQSIMKWSRKFMFHHHTCIPVTISEESKKSFDSFYQMDAPMVYNGVPEYNSTGIAPLKTDDQQVLFIHPASCQPIKNQELLIKAFTKLVQEYPDAIMLWLGNNTNYPILFNTLEQLMPKQFRYVGTVPNVRDYLIQADALCLSSKMEGMPMTIIEGFSVGTPSLCTPVGGIVNMIKDGENGMLSSSLSIDDYYLMLKRFCELSAEEKMSMRKKAKDSFSTFSIENTAKGYLRVYQK